MLAAIVLLTLLAVSLMLLVMTLNVLRGALEDVQKRERATEDRQETRQEPSRPGNPEMRETATPQPELPGMERHEREPADIGESRPARTSEAGDQGSAAIP